MTLSAGRTAATRAYFSLFARISAPLLGLAVLLGGCAARTPVLAPERLDPAAPAELELDTTPFIAQERYQCGPAALAMLLQQSGVAVSAEELVPQVYLPARKGSLQVEMLASGRRYQRIPYVIDPSVQALTSELHAGRPVLVLQNLGLQARPLWHYAVVIGYTQENDHIILRSGTQERQPMPAWLFLKTWETAGHWGIVLLQPGKLPAHPDRDRYLKAVATAEGQIEPRSLLNAYEAALTHWPDDPIAQFGRANALHALGRLQDAGKAYRQIVASDASNIAALNNLAEVYADLGCHQLAEETISEAFASADENAPLRPVLMDTRRRIHQDFHAASASECSATH